MLQRNLLTLFVLVLMLIAACQTNTRHYQPENLRKLSEEEILARAHQKQSFSPYAVFKDSLGLPLSDEYKEKLDRGELAYDYYANAKNEVMELIVREPTYADDLLDIQRRTILAGLRSWERVASITVDCRAKKRILQMVYKREKEIQAVKDTVDLERFMRGFSRVSLPGEEKFLYIDSLFKQNKRIVLGLLEKCGIPTKREVGAKGMLGFFYTFQHAFESRLRVMHYPMLKQCVNNGDLKKDCLAILEDRMMRDFNKKQLYGSQLKKDRETGIWTLHPVRDPENLNKRRKKMGLEPIEEYLKGLDIEYDLAGVFD